jgi:E3 ubiquitin-protein ligase MARCH6
MLFFIPYYWRRRVHAGSALRWLLNKYWRTLAKTLRLSSYFYGVRYEAEEVQGPIERRLLEAHKLWTKAKRTVTRSRAPLPKYNDMQMRVPYADSVALVKPRRNVFVEVDDSGIPITDEGKITAVLQDRVGRKAHRRVKEDYTQVFMPALYPLRFWIFGMSLWVSVAWTCALAMFTPIAIGRMVTTMYFGRQVHDGYSFVSSQGRVSGEGVRM